MGCSESETQKLIDHILALVLRPLAHQVNIVRYRFLDVGFEQRPADLARSVFDLQLSHFWFPFRAKPGPMMYFFGPCQRSNLRYGAGATSVKRQPEGWGRSRPVSV